MIRWCLVAVMQAGTPPQEAPPQAIDNLAVNDQALNDQALNDQAKSNPRIAEVGERLITYQDLLQEWEVLRKINPGLPATPSERQQFDLCRNVVEEYLWIDHARKFPAYQEWATETQIERLGKAFFPDVWEELSAPETLSRPIVMRKAEAWQARRAALQSDPDFQRYVRVRPSELMEYFHRNPEHFEEPARVHLGQVLLSQALLGPQAITTAEAIREQVQQGQSLEVAALALAPGSYRDLGWTEIEGSGLQDEILAFLSAASQGEVSKVFQFGQTVALYQLLERRPGRKRSFEEVNEELRKQLEDRNLQQLGMRYLVVRVMPKAYFEPRNLFEEELKRFGYSRPGR